MKKVLSILAIAAIVFGMASCNEKNEVNPQRFKVSITDVTETSFHLSIVPPDEEMTYVYYAFTLGTCNALENQSGGLTATLKDMSSTTGTIDMDVNDLLPGVKYVLCVAEKDADKKEIIGEVERTRFETKSMEAKLPDFVEEGQEFLSMSGVVKFITENFFVISASYAIPESEGMTLKMYLFIYSEKFDGHFTTDDMFSFFIFTSNVSVEDSEGETEEGMRICGADVTGTYNEETGKYTYRGYCDFFAGKEGVYRLPFESECTVAEEAEEQEED